MSMNPERKPSELETTLMAADKALNELEAQVKAGHMSIGAALARAVLVGVQLERVSK